MPFKSEKQRRYLWATQPDLAKRWAHKYPESNKGLPMYADEKKEEKSAHQPQNPVYVNNCANSILRGYSHKPELNNKAAEDATYRVKLPQSDKPTYAGQEEEEGQSPQIKDENAQIEQKDPENAINSLLQKIAIVLSRPMAQRLENRRAQRELRKPRYQPRNPGIHQYAVPSPYTPMPMGMQPQQPQQAQQPAANTQVSQPANTPSANPINSFGALSSTGNINGNAAFGQKNSPDSSKTANVAALLKMAYGVWDEYAVAERTPWYDFQSQNKLPEYLERAENLAAQQGYQLNFTNQRYDEGVSGKEYADKLRKLNTPVTEDSDEFPHFFNMIPRDNRTFWQKLIRARGKNPAKTLDYLHGHHIDDHDAWTKHVDENWPVYRAYHEVYGAKNSPAAAKTASIYKRAERSEALSKLISMETTEPEDILYYDDEYSDELGFQRKAASIKKATLQAVYEKWAGVASKTAEEETPPKKKPST